MVLEQCSSQLAKATKQETKFLQRYLLILGSGDPSKVRSKGSFSVTDMLGEYVDAAKICIHALSTLIQASPSTLCDRLADEDWRIYLLGPVVERVTYYDYSKYKEDGSGNICRDKDHRDWHALTEKDKYYSIVRFYGKILRMYVERNPAACQQTLKTNFDVLMKLVCSADEILSEDVVMTTQLMVYRLDCFPHFVKIFVSVTSNLINSSFSEQEMSLEPEAVLRCRQQQLINVGRIMTFVLTRMVPSDDAKLNVVTQQILNMQFFPVLLTACFRPSSVQGYVPLLVELLDRYRSHLKGSHLNALDSCVERIHRILIHAKEEPSVRFGMVRISLFHVLLALIRLDSGTVNQRIVNIQLMPALLSLVFSGRPNFTLLQSFVLQIFNEVLQKSRRNKSHSIVAVLLADDPEQLFQLVTLILESVEGKEFGCCPDVAYMDMAKQLYLSLDGITRVKDLLKTQSELLSEWKAVGKVIKTHDGSIEKSQKQTKKVLASINKARKKAQEISNEVDSEFAVVQELKRMDSINGEEDLAAEDASNVRTLQKKVRASGVK